MSASGTASDTQAQLDAVEASIAALPRPPAQAVSQDGLALERTNRLAALSAALSTRVPVDRVLREISYVLPDDVWLTGIRAVAPVSAAPAAATPGSSAAPTTAVEGVTIEGATYSHDGVARVLARLSAVPSLDNVRLTTSTRVEPKAPEAPAPGAKPAKGKKAKKAKKPKAIVTFTVAASLDTGGS